MHLSTFPGDVKIVLRKFSALAELAAAVLLCTVACGQGEENPADGGHVDYAAAISLDMQSETLKQEVTVHAYVDGDTTHFNVPESVMPGGVLKARFLWAFLQLSPLFSAHLPQWRLLYAGSVVR